MNENIETILAVITLLLTAILITMLDAWGTLQTMLLIAFVCGAAYLLLWLLLKSVKAAHQNLPPVKHWPAKLLKLAVAMVAQVAVLLATYAFAAILGSIFLIVAFIPMAGMLSLAMFIELHTFHPILVGTYIIVGVAIEFFLILKMTRTNAISKPFSWMNQACERGIEKIWLRV